MSPPAGALDLEIAVEESGHRLPGRLRVPAAPRGVVLFAHGSGSSRLSPRNRQVAAALEDVELATFLFDLLDDEEAADRRRVFDIALLGRRLLAATDRVAVEPGAAGLPVGYFGASTGAAAALVAAVERPDVRAVVSRGGRPDLAGSALARVRAPTLLIVGGRDIEVLTLNERALERLPGEKRLAIVPRASHLFEEAGAIEQVTELAVGWFTNHLAA
jgi:pimeloyl-ACP methyl ester carboxylesterase